MLGVVCQMRNVGRVLKVVGLLVTATVAPGCRQPWINDADREVAKLIDQRQRAAIGVVSDTSVGPEAGMTGSKSMYSFLPSPIDADVPDAFRRATPTDNESPGTVQTGNTITPYTPTPANAESKRPFILTDALRYALRNSREYQSQKESLYLAALDLTLERYLWTPRFVQSVLDLGYSKTSIDEQDFDRAMSAVSTVAIEQRLPFGGEVTARVINNLMRDIGNNVTTGEPGQLIIDGRIPLLRGAGPVAYESRYQTERNLIYALRNFERFRRQFLVDIASDFFNLQSLYAQIESSDAQATSLAADFERDQALADAERILQIEADRTRVSMLDAQNRAINARERYNTSLDFFKIRLGMPTLANIDIADEELQLIDPEVSAAQATATALKYRLDLLNVRDALDDARRAVNIAKNNILPQVDLTAGVTFNTDPTRPNSFNYNQQRTNWNAGMSFEIPLDRKAQRNTYRGSLIGLRRAERSLDQTEDTVRLEVRREMRRLARTKFNIEIQAEQIRINEVRAKLARAKLEAGELPSNRDVVEAENDLRDGRNSYADAVAAFRRALLEFLLATGTLRVDDTGQWTQYEAVESSVATTGP
jgi:Outer membrane efflux protein